MTFMMWRSLPVVIAAAIVSPSAWAGFTVFESAGSDPASITAARDAFRVGVGGGTLAGPGGSFGGLRREINWDGVTDANADANAFAGNFFSGRGVLFSTPGTGFLVSANAGSATAPLFGFASDFQTFSAQRLFTAVSSNITDVTFVVPGTTTAGTTRAFGAVFVDVEVASLTSMEFFDGSGNSIFSRSALVAGNQSLSFLGAVANAGEAISRVRLTSGANTILSNGVLGNPNDDVVVMDDFIFAEPLAAVLEPETYAMLLAGLVTVASLARRHRRAQ